MANKLKFEELVVGSSLSALSCAFINELPIISLNKVGRKPFPFEYFSDDIDFKFLNFFYDIKTIRSPNKTFKIGLQKLALYDYLAVSLSLLGLMPFGGTTSTIEVDHQNKTIHIKTLGSEYEVEYDKLYVFNTDGVMLDIKPKKVKPSYLVVDWVEVGHRLKTEYEYFEDTNNIFVSAMYLYEIPWKRRNLAVTSTLTKDQIDDINFSEYFVRKRAEKLLLSANVPVPVGGYDLKYIDREVRLLTEDKYSDVDGIKFVSFNENEYWRTASSIQESLDLYILEIGRTIFSYASECCRLSSSKKKILSSCRYHPGRVWDKREKRLYSTSRSNFSSK